MKLKEAIDIIHNTYKNKKIDRILDSDSAFIFHMIPKDTKANDVVLDNMYIVDKKTKSVLAISINDMAKLNNISLIK